MFNTSFCLRWRDDLPAAEQRLVVFRVVFARTEDVVAEVVFLGRDGFFAVNLFEVLFLALVLLVFFCLLFPNGTQSSPVSSVYLKVQVMFYMHNSNKTQLQKLYK